MNSGEEKSKRSTASRKIKPVGADGHRKRMADRFLTGIKVGHPPERDLVEMLMFYSVRVRDTRDSAVLLMERFNGDIRQILDADKKSLCEISGVGEGSADLFRLAGKIVNRLEMPRISPNPADVADAAAEIFIRSFSDGPRNKLLIAYFDSSAELIEVEISDVGLSDLTTENAMAFISTASRRNAPMIAAAYFTDHPLIFPTVSDHSGFDVLSSLTGASNTALIDCFIINSDSIYSLTIGRTDQIK